MCVWFLPPLSPSSQFDEQPGSFSLLFITWDNAWLIISSHASILLIREEPWRWVKKTCQMRSVMTHMHKQVIANPLTLGLTVTWTVGKDYFSIADSQKASMLLHPTLQVLAKLCLCWWHLHVKIRAAIIKNMSKTTLITWCGNMISWKESQGAFLYSSPTTAPILESKYLFDELKSVSGIIVKKI